ncbi:unnamed protein product, partial [Polarella glacialis]
EWHQGLLSNGLELNWETSFAMVRLFLETGQLRHAFQIAKQVGTSLKSGARMWTMQVKAAAALAKPDFDYVEEVTREMSQQGYEPGKEVIGALFAVLGEDRCKALLDELGVDVQRIKALVPAKRKAARKPRQK